ncbi:D-2-hydroxyacid dehydrogenase [bacterium]|nr:D-2-hydroxyacid dehydrogenase [bacterium]
MKTTILDGFTLNPGDLSWHDLERLSDCTIYDRTAAELIVERCREAEIIMTNKVPLSAETIAQLPKLEFINVMATGYNIVDVDAAKERGIVVSNAAGYSTPSVVQHTFALMLQIFNNTAAHSHSVKDEMRWAKGADFSYTLHPWHDLAGKTLGIIGFGTIGKKVAEVALTFGMKVLANRRNMDKEAPEGISYAGIEELLAEADVLSFHCPQTTETKGMVNEGFLKSMKSSAVLINTARGGLVDEQALANALNEGTIAAAGLDVLSSEPPAMDNPLLSAKNCIITPHMAWASKEARQRLMHILVENTRAFLMGEPQNVVNQ